MTIFQPEKSGFRGIDLGESLTEIRKQESQSDSKAPRFEDALGISWVFKPEPGTEVFLEYYTGPGTIDSLRILQSIVLNLNLPNEIVSTNLYNEIEQSFRARYGVPEGAFGQQSWTSREENKTVSLRLLEGKKSISLTISRPN